MLVAGRQISVMRGGKLVAINPGQAVPEAATWSHDVLMRCMKVGQIVNVEKATQASIDEAKATSSMTAVRAKGQVAAKNAGQTAQAKPLSTSEVNRRAAGGGTAPAPKKSTSRANAQNKAVA